VIKQGGALDDKQISIFLRPAALIEDCGSEHKPWSAKPPGKINLFVMAITASPAVRSDKWPSIKDDRHDHSLE
jgi:hypothetical protein